MRIIIASDLHIEVTGREPIRRLVAGIEREEADAIVLAGDLGNPSALFEECLAQFIPLSLPVYVVSGNHDLWITPNEHSQDLFDLILPRITREMGFHWLDGKAPFTIGSIGLAGSIGWYDYSARDQDRNQTDEEILKLKPRFAMDAQRINWIYTDQQFAAACRARLSQQLQKLEDDPSVTKTLVVTHVPVFENMIDRRPHDENWSLGNPYFGHFTMGAEIEKFSKVHWVVSGHTHVGMHGVVERESMPPIATAVIGSDYKKPRYVIVEAD